MANVKKTPKLREELEAQARLSLPDLLQWFGWPRRTWDKTWKLKFPSPRFEFNGHKFWATTQVLEWESIHQFVPSRKAGAQ